MVPHMRRHPRGTAERGDIAPNSVMAGGSAVHGRVGMVMHDRDLERTVAFNAGFGFSDRREPHNPHLDNDLPVDEPGHAESPTRHLAGRDRGNTMAREVASGGDIRWDGAGRASRISRPSVGMSGELPAHIASPPAEGAALPPLFEYSRSSPRRTAFPADDSKGGRDNVTVASPSDRGVGRSLARGVVAERSSADTCIGQPRISFAIGHDAPAWLGRPPNLGAHDPNTDESEFSGRASRVNGLRSQLPGLARGPNRPARGHLVRMPRIGLYHGVFVERHRPRAYPDKAGRANALHAWDVSHNDHGGGPMKGINIELTSGPRLEAECRIGYVEIKDIQIFGDMFANVVNKKNAGGPRDFCSGIVTLAGTIPVDIKNNIRVASASIGEDGRGVVPVVDTTVCEWDGKVGIDQCESQMRQGKQAGIGGTFVEFVIAWLTCNDASGMNAKTIPMQFVFLLCVSFGDDLVDGWPCGISVKNMRNSTTYIECE